jgi:hypothetical protein
VIAQLLKPAGDVVVRRVLGDVVYEQGTDGAAVVCRGDCAVALLACCAGSAKAIDHGTTGKPQASEGSIGKI